MVIQLRPPRRRVNGLAAVQTWSLLRVRPIPDVPTGDVKVLRQALREAALVGGQFVYRNVVFRPRPGVVSLLKLLLETDGRSIDVAAVAAGVYGRPVSLRAVRQLAFRASRTFDRVGCPLAVHCRAGRVFVRPKVWAFERAFPPD